MDKLEKTLKVSKIVFKCVWCVAALLFWIIGLTLIFIPDAANSKFVSWLMWGLFCAPFIIIFIIKYAKKSADDSARDGARHYTYNSNTNTISNHPFAGYVFGFIAGLFIGIIAGPIAVPLFFIKNLAEIIKGIIELKKAA